MDGTALIISGVILIAVGVILELVNIVFGLTADNATKNALKDEYYV